MHINFAPKDEEYLKNLVEAGYYVNVAEAIRDAVRRMRDNFTIADPFVDAVAKGARSLDAGKGQPYTRERHAQIVADAKKLALSNESINPDVIPQ
jgi:Arc/MetJ-type ribon-helix-helix transcriptional regulator